MPHIILLDNDNWVDGVIYAEGTSFDPGHYPGTAKFIGVDGETAHVISYQSTFLWHDGKDFRVLKDRTKRWKRLRAQGWHGEMAARHFDRIVQSCGLLDGDENPSVFGAKEVQKKFEPMFQREVQPGLTYELSSEDDLDLWEQRMLASGLYSPEVAWRQAAGWHSDENVWTVKVAWKGIVLQLETFHFQDDGVSVVGGFESRINRRRPHWFWTKTAKILFQSLQDHGIERMDSYVRKDLPDYIQFLKDTYAAIELYSKPEDPVTHLRYKIADTVRGIPDPPMRKSLAGWGYKNGKVDGREGTDQDLPVIRQVIDTKWGTNPRKDLALTNLEEWWELDQATLLLGYSNGALDDVHMIRHRRAGLCGSISLTPIDSVDSKIKEQWFKWGKQAGYDNYSIFIEKDLFEKNQQLFLGYKVVKEHKHPDDANIVVVEAWVAL